MTEYDLIDRKIENSTTNKILVDFTFGSVASSFN